MITRSANLVSGDHEDLLSQPDRDFVPEIELIRGNRLFIARIPRIRVFGDKPWESAATFAAGVSTRLSVLFRQASTIRRAAFRAFIDRSGIPVPIENHANSFLLFPLNKAFT